MEIKQKKYFWMGTELKVTITNRNHKERPLVESSKNGCYIDHYNSKVRVIYNRRYDVLEQARDQGLQVRMVERTA